MTVTAPTGLIPGTWSLDANHSELGFTVRHMMVSKIRGRFRAFGGTATITPDLVGSAVDVTIDATTYESGNEDRDQAVRGSEYLDVKTYPEYRFTSTDWRANGERYVLTGDLTIRDVTRPVELQFEYSGGAKDPFGNDRIGFSAVGEINRKDFGIVTELPMDGGGVVVGEKVKIELDVEFVRNGD